MKPLSLPLVGPARDDDHSEHRAIAGLPRAHARRLEHLVWPDPQSTSVPATPRFCPGRLAAAERGVINRYRIQTHTITHDPNIFAMSRRERRR